MTGPMPDDSYEVELPLSNTELVAKMGEAMNGDKQAHVMLVCHNALALRKLLDTVEKAAPLLDQGAELLTEAAGNPLALIQAMMGR